MIKKVNSLTFRGIDIVDVDVQVQLISGIPNFIIVGLADKTIAESKERVRGALASMGLSLPLKRIIVNLSPANLVKEGSHFDLAIAVALLTIMDVIPQSSIIDYLILGELSLDGTILPVNGVLPAAIGANIRNKGIICSIKNGKEASWSGNEMIIAANNLLELINHFKGQQIISKPEVSKSDIQKINYLDFKDIKGQKMVKRALEVAAVGNHHLLMYGPPGTGKSMLANRILSILPELTHEEILECSTIFSVAGLINDGTLIKSRSFRAPHTSCSEAAMVGGGMGKHVKPGEVSLAHNGVLFLDELPEFSHSVIESLRQPIENDEILISRSGNNIKYPTKFQLIAAMNPCKCGYFSDPNKICTKAPKCAYDYQSKISGPILDRFDIIIQVDNDEEFFNHHRNEDIESSESILSRVVNARDIQLRRYKQHNIKTNNQLDGQLLIKYAAPDTEALEILNDATKKFRMSIRAYNRILKVARSIADLEDSDVINKVHISEAIGYRKLLSENIMN
ncbi:YifB family Mg chelatase-like AAA ATPase [Rickettsia endosymbiont of Cardiosporidium cionae]|uniref:YifB family Mg chelatase-like AAA ATPase n=1 Tax=Rickettsia endosymbiont of Cardiosporidium cionae TaxID=2777155 RepID=UPI0018943312|nr:YifB family Mg chelatase-like AAA ATPase [Rickettsia endosymbiont of Cardiosporidium cionae]KAF8818533.1 ATP-binding protein [Rickettsia endosymbiont of Cardiosporidium cionae]